MQIDWRGYRKNFGSVSQSNLVRAMEGSIQLFLIVQRKPGEIHTGLKDIISDKSNRPTHKHHTGSISNRSYISQICRDTRLRIASASLGLVALTFR